MFFDRPPRQTSLSMTLWHKGYLRDRRENVSGCGRGGGGGGDGEGEEWEQDAEMRC